MLHGLGGHSHAYADLAVKLTQLGFDVYSMEYSGWGYSEGVKVSRHLFFS